MPKPGEIAAVRSAKPREEARAGERAPRRRTARTPAAGPRGPHLPEGFLTICQPLAGDLARRRAVFLAEPDALNVHALRGAGRRLQAAVALFDAELRRRDAKWVRRELKTCIARLGQLRDLDVLLGRIGTLPREAGAPETRGEDGLLAEATLARRRACAKAIAALRSARATVLVDGFEAWLCEAAADLDAKAPLADVALPALRRLHDRVGLAGRHISGLGARPRHELRLQVKQLRYAAEAVAQLDGVSPSDPYLAALTALSHQLGDMNDDEVGLRLTKALTRGARGRTVAPPTSGPHRRALAKAWARFIAAPVTWDAGGRTA